VGPLSEKQKSARYSQSRTDTLIGAGTCIKGNITFTGVLRTEGGIIGDVSCDDDPIGTLVVGKLGRVTGAVYAPHVVVVGRVDGPVHSSESLEIQPGARVVGDASYKDIVIHEGAVIEGVLMRKLPPEAARSEPEHRVQSLKPPVAKKVEAPATVVTTPVQEIGKRSRAGRNVGLATALLITVGVIVWMNQSPSTTTPTAVAAEELRPADTTATQTPAPQPPLVEVATLVKDAAPLDTPKAVVASAVSLVPSSEIVTKATVQATPPESPQLDPKNLLVVQGDSPNKPGDFVYVVIGKESAVLFKKPRTDAAEGTRIELAQGTSKRISVAKDDILRVAQGRGIQMFYQGHKVMPTSIDGGAWLSFVPVSRGVASGQ